MVNERDRRFFIFYFCELCNFKCFIVKFQRGNYDYAHERKEKRGRTTDKYSLKGEKQAKQQIDSLKSKSIKNCPLQLF